MECKVKEAVNNVVSDGSINRNIVECKEWFKCVNKFLHNVLIETLWNVKTGGTVEAISLAIAVLIETLWNVKLLDTTLNRDLTGY